MMNDNNTLQSSAKFAILGDTHIGCRGDLSVFHDHFKIIFTRMISEWKDQGVTDVFQLGDLFDRRKYINFYSLSRAKHYLFDELMQAGITLHVLLGNHDIFYRESLEVNSPSLVLSEYANIKIYNTSTTVHYLGTSIDIIPWICKDNEQSIMEFIKASKSDLCFGHFEIASFPMYKGIDGHGGLPSSLFSKYERVLSGHYHTRSQRENITYVGTPYEMTWQDFDDPKGYHIFDIRTRTLTFRENPEILFVKVGYDDTQPLTNLDSVECEGKFVKVIVSNKTDLYQFDLFMNKLYQKKCYEIKIVEDLSDTQTCEIDEDIDLEDTMGVMSNYVDSLNTDVDKQKIKTLLKALFIEALNSEVI